MPDDKNLQIFDDYLKSQQNLIGIIIAILTTLLSAILNQFGAITLNVALLIDIPIIIIFLVWMLITSKKSTIDRDQFYNVMVKLKSNLDWGESLVKDAKSLSEQKHSHKLGGNLGRISYNNYILYLYLIALYESDKEKFAKELWDKARISDKSDEKEQIKS